jgi:hypothetical protein
MYGATLSLLFSMACLLTKATGCDVDDDPLCLESRSGKYPRVGQTETTSGGGVEICGEFSASIDISLGDS